EVAVADSGRMRRTPRRIRPEVGSGCGLAATAGRRVRVPRDRAFGRGRVAVWLPRARVPKIWRPQALMDERLPPESLPTRIHMGSPIPARGLFLAVMSIVCSDESWGSRPSSV